MNNTAQRLPKRPLTDVTSSTGERVRLQKFLAAAGVCSRRSGETLILNGRVKVNGEVVLKLGACIDPAQDRVEVDGRSISLHEKPVYLALNKPKGFVTSCKHYGKKVVMELVQVKERVFPIGRLDKDSTGLLLMTNDGAIHHRLLHPSFDHEKEYEVMTELPISDGALVQMEKGVSILGSQTRPTRVTRLAENRFRIVLQEGRNRQIRRMVKRLGGEVRELKRLRVANIHLGDLPEGKWRYLTGKEQEELIEITLGSSNNPLKRKP
jgi:23S rRNA pseudouridine2605 synthase/23S rRNA pseudouridine2604 synthase